MSNETRPGRHRPPGTSRGRHRPPRPHNTLAELTTMARESAQPAMKGAAIIAATGGLVTTLAHPADADPRHGPVPGNPDAVVGWVAPAAVAGPASGTTAAPLALDMVGYQRAAKPIASPTKPRLITDVRLERARAKAAEERRQARERVSRDAARAALPSTEMDSVPKAAKGEQSAYNWGSPGQCTWGVLNKWYQSEGYYPGGWTGNALVWASGAASAGYTVSSVPRTRSIVVMQPGVYGSSNMGHLGWVTAVSGDRVTIIEMNALAGPYNYNSRTITHISGLKYIYAP